VGRQAEYSGGASSWDKVIGLPAGSTALIERTVGARMISHGKALNLGVLGFLFPWRGGFLTGKYHGEGKPDDGRMTNEGVESTST